MGFSVGSPEGRPEDAVSNDEVKFLQVGRGPFLQHAVPLEAEVPLSQPPGHLRYNVNQ